MQLGSGEVFSVIGYVAGLQVRHSTDEEFPVPTRNLGTGLMRQSEIYTIRLKDFSRNNRDHRISMGRPWGQ